MSRWMSCGLAAGVMQFLVGATFHLLIPIVFAGISELYEKEAVFRPWTGLTPIYMAIHPLVYGFVFAGGFLGLRQAASFPQGVAGGVLYGFGVFLVGSLPVFLLMYASLQVPVEIIGLWIAQNLIQYLLAGMAVGIVAD